MTTLSDIGTGFSRTAINNNFDIIEDELNNKVIKKVLADGEDNTMTVNIDMNSNRILNSPTPSSPNDLVRLRDMQELGLGLEEAIDPSKEFRFATVVDYQNSPVVFGVGKSIYITERQASFLVVDGVDDANIYDKLASNEVDQSIVLQPSEPRNIQEYGAVAGDDITDVLNHITAGADVYDREAMVRSIDLRGVSYDLLGKVCLRKGQDLLLGGSHLFMSDTGGIYMGESLSGVPDSGGWPMILSGGWLEGGATTIFSTASGYTISDIFNSASASGISLSGNDLHLSNITMDNGSRLMTLSTSNSTIVNCNWFVGNEQLALNNLFDTVFSNCVFDYADIASVSITNATGAGNELRNVRFDGCSFMKNAQSTGTFLGFVLTNNSGITGDVTFSDCTFRNCHQSAVSSYASSAGLELSFNNCTFDSAKTKPSYAQTTSMSVLRLGGSGRATVNFDGCKFKNMLEQPFLTTSVEAYSVKITNSEFENTDAGITHNIYLAGGNAASSLTLANIDSGGTSLINLPFNGSLDMSGYFKNWLPLKNASGRDYVEIPFLNATMAELVTVLNPNVGGSTNYRRLGKFTAALSYDFSGGALTQATLDNSFVTTTPVGLGYDVQLDINTIGAGLTASGTVSRGLLLLSWPEAYGFESIEGSYNIVDG